MLTTLALAGGLSVVGMAAPASAHHNTITATSVCATDGKSATVTWTAVNSENVRETITSTTQPGVIAKNTVIAAKGSAVGTQTGAELGKKYTLELKGKWDNGNTSTDTGSYTVPAALCDNDWPYDAPTCTALTVKYPKNVSGNDVNIRFVIDGKKLTLNFHNNTGRWNNTQTFTYASHVNWPKPAPDEFVIEWVQVDGTNYHWEGKVDCGEGSKLTICHATASDKNPYELITISKSAVVSAHLKHQKGEDIIPAFTYKGKTYSAQGDQTLLVGGCTLPASGDVTVCHWDPQSTTYTRSWLTVDQFLSAKHGEHTNDIYSAFSYWNWDFPFLHSVRERGDQALLAYTDCVQPTEVPVPAEPAFSDECGVDNYVLTPVLSDAVVWGTEVPVPAEPAFSDECGVDNYVLTPVLSDAVVWGAPVLADGKVSITATPAKGHKFAGASQSVTFGPFTLNDAACDTEVPVSRSRRRRRRATSSRVHRSR
ncbi:hypothetical protein ASE68_12875 [Agromyces sp. Leaf222]|nr:hypothetical protein ASE68_12875 [Agromyces sp. Leaf222]